MIITKQINSLDIPVIAYPEMLSSFSGCIDYGYVVEDELILPFVEVRKAKLCKYIELPTPIVGFCSVDKEQQFLDQALMCIKEEKHPDFIISLNTSPMRVYPIGSFYCKFGSYVLDLSRSEEMLFSGIHSKHRNVIRKAEKDGLWVDCNHCYIDDCIRIIENTYSRQGKSSSSDAYYRNLSKLGERVDFWVVKKGADIQGCAILLWDNNTSYYMHGGSIDHPSTGALNYLHWQAILTMKNRGVKYYDFVGARISVEEGSKLEGIQRFKSRFGGELQVGYRWRLTYKKSKYALYYFLLWIRTRLIHRDSSPIDIIKYERLRGNF